MQLSFWLALLAGLVSFLSPCVLPLVPAYIGYMGGRVTNTVAAQTSGGAAVASHPTIGWRFSTMLHGLAFVAGFAFVFVTIGLLGTAFVSEIGRQNLNAVTDVIGRAGGLLIILFGLHFMGVLPSIFNWLLQRRQYLNSPVISLAALVIGGAALLWIFEDWLFVLPLFLLLLLWLFLSGAFTQPQTFWTTQITRVQRALYTDTRRQMVARGHQSYAGSAIMGVIFSAGWTPCIGPIYGSILTMAATGGDVATAGGLLLAYSLGLGIPFILAAFLLDSAAGILRRLQRYLRAIEIASGVFLIAVGVLVASGRLQYLSQTFSSQISDLSFNFEECAIQLSQGEIPLSNFIPCVNGTDTTDPEAPTDVSLADPPSILSLAADAPETRVEGLNIGNTAPGFSTVTNSGGSFSLADQRGKLVLLNFWATWCGPCRVEMPEFQKAFAAHGDQDFTVVGVNDAESVADVTGFRAEFGLTFPLLMDTNAQLQKLYAVRSYPSTYLIDRDGTIIAQHFGALTAAQIDDLVDQALS